MQSHTLLESQHPPSNEPLNGLTAPRMGPVPEFLRPLPVLSSSNSNTTLKYKKAAINRINQELDNKYNGYNENGELATSDRHDENNQFNSKLPSGNSVYPKHFASMQGPYGMVNKNFLKKDSEVTEDEVKGRGRFLSSDLLNNNTSDKVNSSQVNYSGQFQANFIGHLNNSYLHRHGNVPVSQPPINVPSSQPGTYYNGVRVNGFNGNSESRESNSPSNRNSPQRPTNTPSPQKIEQNQTPYFSTNQEASQAEQGGNRKFKVPTSKVPKESLLKYRILHKNNQRNVTHITPTSSLNESSVPSLTSQDNPSSTPSQTQNTPGLTQTSSRNGSPCDNSNSSNPSFSPGNPTFSVDTTSHNVHFKRPAASSEISTTNALSSTTVNGVQESVNGVINSDIKPNHFSKGVLIKLENGLIKHLEDLKTEDFVSSAENSTRHRLEPSTVLKIEEKPDSSSIVLTLCYGEKRHQVEYESMMEQPYYVINKGWCSFNPNKTHNKYGLVCKQLNVGDTCISLCQKNLSANTTAPQSPNKPTSQSKTSKRKELEKHFNLLSSKDRELNERKRRRWSAPDQINEKTNKKTNAKQPKLNNSANNGETCHQGDGDSTSTNQQGNVASLPTSTNNNIQNGAVSELRTINTPPSSYQQSVPNGNCLISQQPNGKGLIPANSYYQYSNASVSSSSSVVNSHQFPPASIPVSHLNYVTNPSATTPTHLITRPIVSHLPLSSTSTLAMSTSSPATNFSISTLSTPASSKHMEGLLPYGGGGASSKISYLPHPPSLPGMPPTGGPSSNFSTPNYASSNFINGTPISINGTPISSIVYSRNGNYPIPSSGLKYSAPVSGCGSGGKNSFSNVDRLAKSANAPVGVSGGAVDFSKYSTQK
uniref:Ataxin-1 n=1 Tax=Cacopsylla melanoneura TaxID=428564 RepID=A0A8D8M3F9_9HEMI